MSITLIAHLIANHAIPIARLVQDQPIQIASLALLHFTTRHRQNNVIVIALQININLTLQLPSV